MSGAKSCRWRTFATRSEVGALADKVYEVTDLAAASLEETPKIGMTWRHEYIRCIGKCNDDFIVVLDIGAIFAPKRRDRTEFSSELSAGAAV
jgi:purine-binding chemotaxis protein CheW